MVISGRIFNDVNAACRKHQANPLRTILFRKSEPTKNGRVETKVKNNVKK